MQLNNIYPEKLMKLNSIRREYSLTTLSEKNIARNPVEQFRKWMDDAIKVEAIDPTAFSLATMGPDEFPESRIVLLKDFNDEGFTFFTNYNSNKGEAINENPKVGLHFYWPELERQIRISGLARVFQLPSIAEPGRQGAQVV